MPEVSARLAEALISLHELNGGSWPAVVLEDDTIKVFLGEWVLCWPFDAPDRMVGAYADHLEATHDHKTLDEWALAVCGLTSVDVFGPAEIMSNAAHEALAAISEHAYAAAVDAVTLIDARSRVS